MRALTYDDYGGPDTHRLRHDEPRPEPGAGQVRVRVGAAGINPYDWHIYRGDPWLARASFGLRSPGHRVVGADVAGTVDALGPGVDGVDVGERVAGMVEFGACAEQALVPLDRLARVPDGVSDVEAAAIPVAGLTALCGLRDLDVPRRPRVLVIGASGGVGHMAVQVARILGARRVVAVCSGRNAAMVTGLGADRVIDYTREAVTDCGEVFDIVFDTVATTSLRRLRHLIAPGGIYAPAGGLGGGPALGPAWPMVRSVMAGWTVRPKVRMAAGKDANSGPELEQLLGWVEEGRLRPVIEDVLALDRHVEAFERLEAQHVAGKLVLTP